MTEIQASNMSIFIDQQKKNKDNQLSKFQDILGLTAQAGGRLYTNKYTNHWSNYNDKKIAVLLRLHH